MSFKKIINKLHLWLGFLSGAVIIFLAITGCILAFEQEIRNFTEAFRFVKVEEKSYLPPSILKTEAEKYLEGKKAAGVEYPGKGRAAIASYYGAGNYKLIYLNPFSGQVLKVKDMNHDFFRNVLLGHYYLWLPPNIGQPVVSSFTLAFLVMMITGLIQWWPKNKAAARQRFSIKWSARWRRRNYDLHHVLGFYMTWIGIFLAITGLVMGFQWFARSVYWVSSGGKPVPRGIYFSSDTATAGLLTGNPADKVWILLSKQTGENESLGIYFPFTNTSPVEGNINHRPGTFYNTDYHHFDQYTLKELTASGTYTEGFRDASIPDKVRRMNYDIHVGAVLGLPGKILAFLASLIAGSLPVTGFYIWWGRRKKKRRELIEKDEEIIFRRGIQFGNK